MKGNFSKEQLKYVVIRFRTKKQYLLYQVLQLILSIVIIIVAFTNHTHFKTPAVLILELILWISMAVDLFLIRWISEGSLLQKKTNIFDLILLGIFAGTLLFLAITSQSEQKDYRQILQADDIIIIVIVMLRYALQFVRLFFIMRNTSSNLKLQKQMKGMDLNMPMDQSINFKELDHDKIMREKMAIKHVKLNQQVNGESDRGDSGESDK